MNRKVYTFFPLFLSCLFFLTSTSVAQQRDFKREAFLLKDVILKNHYRPKVINDQFAQQFYDLLLNTLDGDKLIFTETDLKPLQSFRTTLDDELNGKSWLFFNQLMIVYKKCLERADRTIVQLANQKVNATVKEYFISDTVNWVKDEIALKEKWRVSLKLALLDRLTSRIEPAMIQDPGFFATNEPVARQRAIAAEQRTIKRILQHPSGFENYFASVYYGTFAAMFDPHSAYLSTTDMENFLSSLSTEGYYFGVTIDENDRGDIVISGLAPGGPAWKSGEIQAGDVLLSLTWAGQDKIDMDGVSMEEVNEILGDANHNAMEFSVKRVGGIQKTIHLRKEKISMEQNVVRSFILHGKNKIGYISLPDFYTQWGDEVEGSRCASDVAKEIIKLKKENIEGLILDVRFNGGGSLHEALALAGIFIDEGSFGILRDRLQNETSVKDFNRGTAYDGPLLVMVNGQSASASEFLAAALQDYNRAFIVGSKTYGKATAQNFFPVNPLQKDGPSLATLKTGEGYATITTDKIYRVTGMTAQAMGVTPDILLPDFYDVVILREARLPFALPADTIYKKTYYKPLASLPLSALKKNSEQRITSLKSFTTIRETSLWLKDKIKKQHEPVLLTWADFSKDALVDEQRLERVERSVIQKTSIFDVQNNVVDQQHTQADDYTKDFNQRWIEKLKEDIYVAESFQIVCDYIELKKK